MNACRSLKRGDRSRDNKVMLKYMLAKKYNCMSR